MSEVIYRKYRARTFAEIQAQTVPVSVITHAFKTGQFAHAYLFAGPRGTGKTSMARLVAKAANCINFEKLGDVCNECEACKAIDAGNFMDLYEIDAASNRGIDEIRQLKESINFLPVQGKRKVYIIDEVHMLTREAFNALLKTLEEPPEHVIFILATTEPHKIPVTILSRVQRFDFRLAQQTELQAKLKFILDGEGFTAEEGVFELIHTHSEGSFRDAESLLGKIISNLSGQNTITSSIVEQVLGIASREITDNLIAALVAGQSEKALEILDDAQAQGVDLVRLIAQLASELRRQVVSNLRSQSEYQSKLVLLSGILSLQAELKQIDDPRLLIDVFVLKQNKSAAQSKEPQAPSQPSVPEVEDTPVAAKPLKVAQKVVTEAVKIEPKSAVDVSAPAAGSQQLTDQWTQLVAKIRKQSFKYWTMIKICSPKLDGNTLTITSIYPTNLQNLQSADIIDVIRAGVAEIFGNVELRFDVAAKPEVVQVMEMSMGSPGPMDSNAELIEAIL
jgi:DNA polymerase-3 subunit gamma/tau